MGRTYLFECSRCAYRVHVSGKVDRGFGVCVETISCRECKKLYDVVTRLRVPDSRQTARVTPEGRIRPDGALVPRHWPEAAPSLQSTLNRLQFGLAQRFLWVEFKKRCPVSNLHHVRSWNDPDKCPQCGTYLERHGLPYRIWD